jgi:hypothetical protein
MKPSARAPKTARDRETSAAAAVKTTVINIDSKGVKIAGWFGKDNELEDEFPRSTWTLAEIGDTIQRWKTYSYDTDIGALRDAIRIINLCFIITPEVDAFGTTRETSTAQTGSVVIIIVIIIIIIAIYLRP